MKLKSPPLARVGAEKNYYRFRLGPDITLATGLRVKQPGAKMVPMPIELAAVDHAQGDEVDAYERLLTDAMRGQSLLFVREDALEASWAVVEQVLGNVSPAHVYEPGSWDPTKRTAWQLTLGAGMTCDDGSSLVPARRFTLPQFPRRGARRGKHDWGKVSKSLRNSR